MRLLVFLPALVLAAACGGETPFKDFGIPTQIQGLKTQQGKPFSSEELKGNAVWVFFGFTSCPEVCPMTLSKLAKAKKKLGFRGRKLKTVFISVDPERDTPEKIANYLSNFPIEVIGLSGSLFQTKAVARNYGVYFEKTPLKDSQSGAYTVNHTASVFLLDPDGQLRYIFPYRADADRIASITKLLLPLF